MQWTCLGEWYGFAFILLFYALPKGFDPGLTLHRFKSTKIYKAIVCHYVLIISVLQGMYLPTK